MFPRFAVHDTTDILKNYAKLPSDFRKTHAFFMQAADFVDFACRQFGVVFLFAPRLPTFRFHVGHIVTVRTKKKMMRVTARWIIASVEYPQIIGYWAVMQFVSKPRGNIPFAFVDKFPITAPVFPASPQPAFIWRTMGATRPKCISQRCVVALVVPADKTEGLILYPSELIEIAWRKPCLLSAPTAAVTIWDFVRGLARGMIAHSKVSLLDFAQAWDVCRVARHFLLGSTAPLYHIYGNGTAF